MSISVDSMENLTYQINYNNILTVLFKHLLYLDRKNLLLVICIATASFIQKYCLKITYNKIYLITHKFSSYILNQVKQKLSF